MYIFAAANIKDRREDCIRDLEDTLDLMKGISLDLSAVIGFRYV